MANAKEEVSVDVMTPHGSANLARAKCHAHYKCGKAHLTLLW